jgi:hypothetical protein
MIEGIRKDAVNRAPGHRVTALCLESPGGIGTFPDLRRCMISREHKVPALPHQVEAFRIANHGLATIAVKSVLVGLR